MQKKSLIPRSVCCYLVAALCAFSVLSCTTSRTATSTVTHSEGDSLRALSAQYAAVSQQLSRYDSLFSQMQARITAQQSTQEQSTERIQESVTTCLVRQNYATSNRSPHSNSSCLARPPVQTPSQKPSTCSNRSTGSIPSISNHLKNQRPPAFSRGGMA